MLPFQFDAMTSAGDEVTGIIKANSRRAARQELAARGLFVIRLVERDSSEDASEEPTKFSANDKADTNLSEFGWVIEPIDLGIRIRRSGLWYAGMAGCSTMLLLVVLTIMYGFLSVGSALSRGPIGGGMGVIISRGIATIIYGVYGVVALVGILHVLRFVLLREVWKVSRNLLFIRRSVLGIGYSHEYRAGEFVLELHYSHGEQHPHWRLALHNNGQKRFLITRPLSFLSQSTADSLAECRGLATLLTTHTGWNLKTATVSVENQASSPAAADDEELIASLRRQGCRVSDNAGSPLLIVPPQWRRRFSGLLLSICGVAWVWFISGVIASFVGDPEVSRKPLMQIPFWLIMTPMLLVGAAFFTGGLSLLIAGEQWAIDKNSLQIHHPWIRWKEAISFVNASMRLEQATNVDQERRRTVKWHLQVRSAPGTLLRVLLSREDDDLPRLLGTIISRRAGWPMRESQDCEIGSLTSPREIET
jgi:hypothetical protein